MRARSGALAVLGNHDHWVDAETGRWWLSQNGIGIIENRHRVFKDERERLVVAGVGMPMGRAAGSGCRLRGRATARTRTPHRALPQS